MLPKAIHDHPRDERAGAVLDVRHPFRHGPPLLSRVGPAAFGARGRPIVLGRFASGERSQETQLDRLSLRMEIAPCQPKGFAWFRAEISAAQRPVQRVWFA